jgi:hypothetical protein
MPAPGREGEGAPDNRGNASRRDRTAGDASLPAPRHDLLWSLAFVVRPGVLGKIGSLVLQRHIFLSVAKLGQNDRNFGES